MATIDDILALQWPCTNAPAQKQVMEQLYGYLETLYDETVKKNVPFYLYRDTEPGVEDFNLAWVANGDVLPIPDYTFLYWILPSTREIGGVYTVINSGANFIRIGNPHHLGEDLTRTSIINHSRTWGEKFLQCRRSWDGDTAAIATGDTDTRKIQVIINPPVDSRVFIKQTFQYDFQIKPTDTSTTSTELLFHYDIDGVIQEQTYPHNTGVYPDGLWRANLSRLTGPFIIYRPIPTIFLANTEYTITYGFTIESDASGTNYRNVLAYTEGYGIEVLPNDIF